MQPNLEVIYRPNAIRTLCRIIDGQMIQGVERFFKTAMVDKNSSIASAALVSAYHLHPVAKDIVKRWANEAQEALSPKSSGGGFGGMSAYGAGSYGLLSGGGGASAAGYQAVQSSSNITQYHAIGLLYLIRQSDRMAVTKLIQQTAKPGAGASAGLRSPFALCMLIRYAAKVMDEDPKCVRGSAPSR